MKLNRQTWHTALPIALLMAGPAWAQAGTAPQTPLVPVPPPLPVTPQPAGAPSPDTPTAAPSTPASAAPASAPASGQAQPPLADNEVGFSANQLEYDDKADIVTATGEVRMTRQGNRLRADKVVWNRATGQVQASGDVIVSDPQGNTAYGDSVQLTDTLKDGVVENMLLVLEDGGRLAARHGKRVDGITTLTDAAYTPCSVTCDDGRPKQPLWKITAVRVIHNPTRHRIYYKDATLTLLGAPILWAPHFSHPDGSGAGDASGLLIPDVQYNKTLGFEVATPYYWLIAPNQDLLVTPRFFTAVLPALDLRYRRLTSNGAFQISGSGTYSARQSVDPTVTTPGVRSFRGYIDANGIFQFGPYWTISGSIRRVTDKTYLRRYDISNDDRLRSVIKAERIDDDSYLSIAGWAFEGLRITDTQGQSPIVLPAIDYRRRLTDPLLGGKIELEANSLSIVRTEGQDTQRAFASVRWDLRRVTGLGQVVTLTGYGRGDIYHTDDVTATATSVYRGTPGWTGRGIAAAALDVQWPFVGTLFGGTQRITPRVQLVASPPTKNLDIPNEDARAVDLEDSNLFALNRFPGYDRWEDGTRVTYGLEYALDLPHFSLQSTVGQSYRFGSGDSTIFPAGTGLSSKTSDIVGRTTLAYGSYIRLTDRFRLDKNSLAIRTNEVDLTLGSSKSYLTAGYLDLNRNISPSIEDLRDHEEVQLGARLQFLEHWSLFGSTVIDLTDSQMDPLSTANGFEPVRHRLGIDYEDSCFEFGLTWRREYLDTGDARRGNSFLLRLAFKNLGR